MPDGQDFQGTLEIFLEVIEKDIPQPGPKDQTEDQIKIKVQQLVRGKERGFLSSQLGLYQEIGEKKAEEVHQSVPADLQGPE
jgi:hypothetical protein